MAKIAFLSVYEMSFTLTHELKLILATLSLTGSYITHQFCPATIFGIVLIWAFDSFSIVAELNA